MKSCHSLFTTFIVFLSILFLSPAAHALDLHLDINFDYSYTPYQMPASLQNQYVSPAPPGERLPPPSPAIEAQGDIKPWTPLTVGLIPQIPDLGTLIFNPGPFDLMIITHKDFIDELEPLKQHKEYLDVKTHVFSWQSLDTQFTDQGSDIPERIKKAIWYYRKNCGIKYVMLVGDSDMFPVRYCRVYDSKHWGNGYTPADLYYADLFKQNGSFDDWDGNGNGIFCEMQGAAWTPGSTLADINLDGLDLYPDIALGRVPASTKAEVTTYVNKVISYEFASYKAPWFKKSLLIVPGYHDKTSDPFEEYPGSWSAKEYVANKLESLGFTTTKLYDHRIIGLPAGLGDGDPSVDSIRTTIDNGVGFLNFSGHGNTNVWGNAININEIKTLNNADKLPVAFAAACSTARFHADTHYLAKDGTTFNVALSCPNTEDVRGCWPANPNAAVAPEPACLQKNSAGNWDQDSMAEGFLVKKDTGTIAYIGSYTGAQGGSQYLDKYFFAAYAASKKPPTLGFLWNSAVKRYIDNDFHINFNSTHDWVPAAMYHHIQKYMLFGDPSLRVGGVSHFQRNDFTGTYNMAHDGWFGQLELRKKHGDTVEGTSNISGKYIARDGREHAVWGYVRTAEYPVPDSNGPDHKINFHINFNDTPDQADDQKFEGYIFTHGKDAMAGITYWNNTPFGFYSTKSGHGQAGFDVDTWVEAGTVEKQDFLGTYQMNHDGWTGTLTLWAVNDDPIEQLPNIKGTYTDQDGKSHQVRAWVQTPTYPLTDTWGPRHKIMLYIDFADTPQTGDDQKFEGYLFTRTKDAFAGVTYWNGTPFGFYAKKQWPQAAIMANGKDSSTTVATNTPVSITVTLDPGAYKQKLSDWWFVVNTPFGWFSFVYPTGWVSGLHMCIQAPLFTVHSVELLNIGLPAGDYIFYFAVDNLADGKLNTPWWDYVSVYVQ